MNRVYGSEKCNNFNRTKVETMLRDYTNAERNSNIQFPLSLSWLEPECIGFVETKMCPGIPVIKR